MLRLAATAALALALLASPPADPCDNIFPHEPIVLYEVSGGTLSGPYDLELAVYADGFARLSSASAGASGRCRQAYVGPAAALELLKKLSAAGAFELCDHDAQITDMPLSTLTVLRPRTATSAHTASWFLADASYQTLELALAQFQAVWFPGF